MKQYYKCILAVFVAMFVLVCLAEAAEVPTSISDRISRAIKSYLVEKDPSLAGKRIEISYKYADKIFRELKYRKGSVTFSVAELYPDFKPIGNMIVPIQVTIDGEQKDKLFLRTKVSVFDKIVVAKKRFKRGELIQEGDATLEVRDISNLLPDILREINLVAGKEVKTFIPSGNAIYDHMIKDRPYVKKDEKVKISSSARNILVMADGLSMEDGKLGQEVRVKSLGSGREIIAVVTGTAEVTVR